MNGTIDLSQVDVLEAVEIEIDRPPVSGWWPCPVCGERRPIARSASARIRNRSRPHLERWIRLCADCASPFLRSAPPPGQVDVPPEVDPALEPWLVSLEHDTSVRRALRHFEG